MELSQLSRQQFDRFSAFIYKRSGIRIDARKISLLTNRIRRRAKAGGFEDFDAYYRFLISPAGTAELERFFDAITTNETFFFRTAKHFKWIADEWIPELTAKARHGERDHTLRIWSAGCATGAEPYSIAISISEAAYQLRNWTVQIIGTDISGEALQAARAGKFKSRAVEAVTEKQRRRYFKHLADDDSWQVRPEIQEFVEFKKHNLMQPAASAPFDCIFIRNVLIYFDSDSKRVVIQNLIDALAPGGYLVVGPSEGLYDMLEPLSKIQPLLYQKPDAETSKSSAESWGDRPR